MDPVSGHGDVVALITKSRSAPPPRLTLLAEGPRALYGLAELVASRRALAGAPRGGGEGVLLLPGLANVDLSNALLRRFLVKLGYRAEGWGLGQNRGLRTIGRDGERLFERIEAMAAAQGGPVALVGVSLGGIMARVAAGRRPDLVSRVVTIAAPFGGPPTATNVWRVFEALSGDAVGAPHVRAFMAEAARPLTMPATAIWSRSDGFVNGFNCRPDTDTRCRSVEIRSSHLWVQMRAATFRAVADALAGD